MPTEEDIERCEYSMTMKQLKTATNGIYENLPKSFSLHGQQIPRSLLRKRDLCILYLQHGGEILPKQRRRLQHFKPSKKPSIEQRKYERLMHQRTLDHKGPVPSTHEPSSKVYAGLVGVSEKKPSKTRKPSIERNSKRSKERSKPSRVRGATKRTPSASRVLKKLKRLQLEETSSQTKEEPLSSSSSSDDEQDQE